MAIFNNPSSTPAKKEGLPFGSEPTAPASDTPATADFAPVNHAAPSPAPRPAHTGSVKESVIASDLTIEGKIEGAGHVRIAGKFKGDVNVEGDLTIEQGARLAGGVRANKVTVAGDLEGNIEAAKQVDLVQSGAINGDLKADTLTVAAGSRIRGRVECGNWADSKPSNGKSNGKGESGNA